jgi:hypothetical protein
MDFGLVLFLGFMVFLMWPMVELLSNGGIVENMVWLVLVTIAVFLFGVIMSVGYAT